MVLWLRRRPSSGQELDDGGSVQRGGVSGVASHPPAETAEGEDDCSLTGLKGNRGEVACGVRNAAPPKIPLTRRLCT